MNLPQQKLIQDTDSLYEESISVLKKYEPPEGYRLAFSGGKDSIVCYHLLKDAGCKFETHYSVTTIDPPEVTSFIRRYYPDAIWDYPVYKGERTNFYKLVEKKGLPTRKFRWCCEVLKESHGTGCSNVLGVRREESARRAKRQFYDIDLKTKTVLICPIIHWKTTDIWDFIHSRNLPYPSLYDEGIKRVGCVFCPMSCRNKRINDYYRYPNRVKVIVNMFDKFQKTHETTKMNNKTAEEFVHHWIFEGPEKSAKGQCLNNFINEKDDNE